MTTEENDPPRFPLYVRILAVAHVLSLIVAPIGLIVFGTIGCIVFMLSKQVDVVVLLLWATAASCPALGALYRRWFENWGRANWPDGKPDRF